MKTQELDFSKRYMVGHGTSIYATFGTAAELNAWHDTQNSHDRYFCRLYDRSKEISVLGSDYMWYDDSKRWKDELPEPEKRPSVAEKLKQPLHEPSLSVKAKAPKSREPER